MSGRMETLSFFSGQLYSLGSLNCGGGTSTEPEYTWLAEPSAFFPRCLERGQDPHRGPVPWVLGARQATGCLASVTNARPRWAAGVKLLEFADPSFPLALPIINWGWRRLVF